MVPSINRFSLERNMIQVTLMIPQAGPVQTVTGTGKHARTGSDFALPYLLVSNKCSSLDPRSVSSARPVAVSFRAGARNIEGVSVPVSNSLEDLNG
jgi:hypothetical protein